MALPKVLSAPSLPFHSKIPYIIPVIPQIFLPIWLHSCRSLGPQIATQTVFTYWNDTSPSIFMWDATSLKIYWSDMPSLVLFCLIICGCVSNPQYSKLPKANNCVLLHFYPNTPTTCSHWSYTSAKLKWFWKINHGVEKYLLCWTYEKKAEMEVGFQKSGFDLRSAFYKMKTSGKIFTFHFNLPEAQIPHL